MLHIASIQMPIFASHLHPSSISPPTSSNHVRLTSILVPSHPHTGREMNITSIHIPSHLHQGPYSYISLPSRSRFTSTHVQTFASHLNPGNESTLSCSWECISALRSHYKELQVSKCMSSFHPIPVSLAPRSPNSCNLPHLCTVSSVSRSLDSNLTSIHVTSHLQPGPEFGVSPHSRSHVTSIQVTRIAHQLHPSPIPTFPCIKICSLTQSRSHRTPSISRDWRLISIYAPRFTSPPHQDRVSPESRSIYLPLNNNKVMFHLHSSPTKLHLRSTQAPSQTHPGFNMCVKLPSWSCSTKFRSQDSCLAFIHEPSPSRSINLHLSQIEVASQFNPGPHIHLPPPYKHPY